MQRRADAALYDREELEETYDSLSRLRYGTARLEDVAAGAIDPIVHELFEDATIDDRSITLPFEEYAEYLQDLEDVIERSDDGGRFRAVTDGAFRKGYDEMDARIDADEDLQGLYQEVRSQRQDAVRAAAGVKGGPVVGLGVGYAIDPPLAALGALAGLGLGLGGVISRDYRVKGRERRVVEELSGQELGQLGDHRVRVEDREGKTWSPEREYGTDDGQDRDWDQKDVEEAIERLQSLEDV